MSDPGPLPLSPLAAALWARAEREEPVRDEMGAGERLLADYDAQAVEMGQDHKRGDP